MMDQDTLTEFDEFRRRSYTQQHGNLDTLSRIEQEAAEFLHQDAAAVSIEENALASLAAQLGIRLPQSALSSSPASDETVTAYERPQRRRIMTQRRYRGSEMADLLPPAAPSPPPNTYYPANIPVYPPTLVTARSEPSMQRASDRVSSGNASMGRNVSFGQGSLASVVRRVPSHDDDHVDFSSSDEEKSSDNGNGRRRGTRRSSAQLQQSEGEQVRLSQSPFAPSSFHLTFPSHSTPFSLTHPSRLPTPTPSISLPKKKKRKVQKDPC
jgi:hypothetical protein